jgi:alpha-tubulin suppressor-like RCC1 family protein
VTCAAWQWSLCWCQECLLFAVFLQAVGRWAAIAISDSHSAGLSCEGQLYTWGNNNRGQLGLGDKCPGVVDTPVPVQSLAELDVK